MSWIIVFRFSSILLRSSSEYSVVNLVIEYFERAISSLLSCRMRTCSSTLLLEIRGLANHVYSYSLLINVSSPFTT